MIARFRLAIAAVSLTLTSTASAEDKFISESGTVFLQKCGVTHTDMCVFYVAGVLDGARSMSPFFSGRKPFCPPANATVGQMLAVGLKQMKDHPEWQHWRASELLILSWVNSFPCPPTK